MHSIQHLSGEDAHTFTSTHSNPHRLGDSNNQLHALSPIMHCLPPSHVPAPGTALCSCFRSTQQGTCTWEGEKMAERSS